VVAGHAYSVVGYSPKKDAVLLRNPWGRGEYLNDKGVPEDGRDDGLFSMKLTEFKKSFFSVAYEAPDESPSVTTLKN